MSAIPRDFLRSDVSVRETTCRYSELCGFSAMPTLIAALLAWFRGRCSWFRGRSGVSVRETTCRYADLCRFSAMPTLIAALLACFRGHARGFADNPGWLVVSRTFRN